MQVQLKAKHFFLIANLIKGSSIEKYLNLFLSIKEQLQSISNEDQLISVQCAADNIIEIYTLLGSMSENMMASINAEMKGLLLPQMQTGVVACNEDWIKVGSYVQGMEASSVTQLQQLIDAGKAFLTA